MSNLGTQILDLDEPFKTSTFPFMFYIIPFLKQTLKAPGPHVSKLGTQTRDLNGLSTVAHPLFGFSWTFAQIGFAIKLITVSTTITSNTDTFTTANTTFCMSHDI